MAINPVLRNFFLTLGGIVLVGGASYVYINRTPQTEDVSVTPTTTTQTLSDGTVISGLPLDATITEITEPTIVVPDYTKPIIITQPLAADVQVVLKAQFEETKQLLAKNPKEFDSWIRLGTLRKIAGDYQGAAEDWEYVSKIFPTNVVSFNNLGELYTYFLKEYGKAVINLKQAIAFSPHTIDPYRSLFYLYRDIYKDKAKASAIIAQGLAANPNNSDLIVLQGQINVQQ